jgi:4-carboxymuconolactone decarboxylase
MHEKRDEGLALVREMISPTAAEVMANADESEDFGAFLATLALENAFCQLWLRPGLTRRVRSFVTLGILIALRADEELRFHFPIALKNGLSKGEIAEVIYQSSAYAGLPAANAARAVASQIFMAD